MARQKMREEADHYLELIEQALKATQTIEHLFSCWAPRWMGVVVSFMLGSGSGQ